MNEPESHLDLGPEFSFPCLSGFEAVVVLHSWRETFQVEAMMAASVVMLRPELAWSSITTGEAISNVPMVDVELSRSPDDLHF
jgi:hypothetical protein